MRAPNFPQLAVSCFCLVTYLGSVRAQETTDEPEVGVYDWGCVGNCFAALNATAQIACPTSDNENEMYNCVTGCSGDVSAQNMYVAGWEIQNMRDTAPTCQSGANNTLSTSATNTTSTQSVATSLSSLITSATASQQATKSANASGSSGANASGSAGGDSNSALSLIASPVASQLLVIASIVFTLYI